jgi:hypothetical protein
MSASFSRHWVIVWAAFGGSPAALKTPTGVLIFVQAPWATGLARAARNQCGGEWSQWRCDLVASRGHRGVYL